MTVVTKSSVIGREGGGGVEGRKRKREVKKEGGRGGVNIGETELLETERRYKEERGTH